VDWEGRLGVLVKSLRVTRVAYSATVSLNSGAGSHGLFRIVGRYCYCGVTGKHGTC